MGFDIVHFNLHKSFTQPHGGGGPGSGPDRGLRPHRALPAAPGRHARRGRRPFDLDDDAARSRSAACAASRATTACFVRSYAYICSLGAEGLQDASRDRGAQRQLPAGPAARAGVADTLPLAFGELCMHEFVLSGAPMKRDLGIRTLDLAKRLLDHGYHPPTVYFPLLVDEALLVEPTETETRETLDAFAEAIAEILREAAGGPEDRAQRALHHAGAPSGRGGGGEAAGHSPAAVARRAFVRLRLRLCLRLQHHRGEADLRRRDRGGRSASAAGELPRTVLTVWLLATQPRTVPTKCRPPSTLSCLYLAGPGEVRTAPVMRPGRGRLGRPLSLGDALRRRAAPHATRIDRRPVIRQPPAG